MFAIVDLIKAQRKKEPVWKSYFISETDVLGKKASNNEVMLSFPITDVVR